MTAPPPPPGENDRKRSFVVLGNPTAGRGRGHGILEAARRALAHREGEVVLARTPEEITARTRAAVANGAHVVAAAGGDGTMQLVAEALAGSNTAMGILPCGRGNDLARALGIPRDPATALRLLLEGRSRAFDVGAIGARRFVTIATCGLDAEVASVVHRGEVPGTGTLAYLLAALRTLPRFRAAEVCLTGDFGELRGRVMMVATANTTTYGGGMRIAPRARADDGLLDVCVVLEVGRLEILRVLPRVFGGGHEGHPAVRMLRTRTLGIESDRPLAIYADGEPIATTPVRIEALPAALQVIAP